MKFLKKLVNILTVSVLMVLLVGGVVVAAETIVISFWGGWTGPDKFGMEKIVNNFVTENPDIKVEFFTAPWTEVFTKFSTTYGTNASPDLLAMHVTDISQFASRGMLMNIADIAAANNIKPEDFPVKVWEGQFYNGEQYGIPLDYHPMAVYKNADIYSAAGIDPNVTWNTMDSFVDSMQKITKDGIFGLAIGVNHPHTMRYWYSWLFQQEGGAFLNETQNQAVFNSEQGVKALQFIHDLIYKYKVVPPHESDIDKDFLSRNVASLIEGPWWVPGVKEQKDLNITVAPFPQVFDKPAVWAGSHTLTLPNKTDKIKTDAAIKLLSYIVTHSVDWGNSGQIPASLSVIQSDAYKNLPDYKYYKVFIEQANDIRFEPLVIQNAIFGSDNQMSPVLNAVLAVALDEADPKEALDTAANEVNALF